ncbi:Arabinanase/levansucrase/invertase [Aspergillus ellipticus CBS 707.79]|uniref:Arabinanase/levansucrase/invertase n=1 Tax=Aspergillus ellipticus CBS 707.79 TaxID=1448320 RepID=A0A319E1Z1_9EURO|nr:Arabinanase/levansucrase/invertase [Aspergillus ellipticus CBS 707.79]
MSTFSIAEPSDEPTPMLPPRIFLRRILKAITFLILFLVLLYPLYTHYHPPPPIPSPSPSPPSPEPPEPPSLLEPPANSPVNPPVNPPIIPDPSPPNPINPDPIPEPQPQPQPYPDTHITDLPIHDPSIIYSANTKTYFAYGSGPHIPIHTAPALSGPWTKAGTVLDGDSILPKGDVKAPWAPTTIHHNGLYYCFYATSNSGCRNSAIGVATSSTPGPGEWTDHGPLAVSGTGITMYPFDRSNAIDVSVIVDPRPHPNPNPNSNLQPGGLTKDPKPPAKKAYLSFGSFWTGIWQVPLHDDLLSLAINPDTRTEDVRHIASEPSAIHPPGKKANGVCGDPTGMHPIEGPFVSFRDGWFYLWFSWGRCCHFDPEKLPRAGLEYSIRVGRSRSPRGPFLDKMGRDLVNGGGEIVYGSNGDVYAPGGQGVLALEEGDVLYYHYLRKSIGYEFHDARLGYSPLVYVDGWPVAQ